MRKGDSPMPDNQSRMTKSIVLAGLLGGLLGGVASFAASRMIAPVPAPKPDAGTTNNPAAHARPVAEDFIGKLRTEKADELADQFKAGLWLITEQEYASFRGQFTADRGRFAMEYGERTGEFELVRETVLSPSLARFVYLEKYQRDGVLWFLVLYQTAGGWRVIGVSWKEKLAASVSGLD